jgi:hypothetical protein
MEQEENLMVQKIGIFLFKLLTLSLFSVAGIRLGIVAFQVWLKIDASGIFVRWQLLESPQKFRHLIYASQNEVIAQNENGKYYIYQSDPCYETVGTICDKWVESQPGLEFDSLTKRIVESGCKSAYEYYTNDIDYSDFANPRYPPRHESTLSECVIKLEFHPDGGEILNYYVLLDNGEVWKWIHKSIALQNLIYAIGWAPVGLIIGLIAWYRFQKSLDQDKKTRNSVNANILTSITKLTWLAACDRLSK